MMMLQLHEDYECDDDDDCDQEDDDYEHIGLECVASQSHEWKTWESELRWSQSLMQYFSAGAVSLCNIELTKKSERWNLHLYQITEEARISSLGNFSLQGGLLFKDCPQCIMSSRFKIGTLSRFCFGRTRLGVTFYTHASQDWDSWWYAHVWVLVSLWPWFCIFLNWWQGRYLYFISWYVTSYIFYLPSAIRLP